MDTTRTKVTGPAPLDSAAIDLALLVQINTAQRQRINRARWSLQAGLRKSGRAAQMHFEQALRELGRLGAD